MKDKIFKEIQETIKEKFKKNVTLDMEVSSSGIDSLDLLDLVVEIEEKYEIKISDGELSDIKTFSNIVDLVNEKKK